MGVCQSTCCRNQRDNSFRFKKPDKTLNEHSPVFPNDSTSLQHVTVTKQDSSGSAPFSLIHQVVSGSSANRLSASYSPGDVGGASGGIGSDLLGQHQQNQTTFSGSSPVGLTVLKGSDLSQKKGGLVSRIPPLGRSGSSEFKGVSETKVLNLFAKYRDSSEDAILAPGIESLCQDLELKPDEFKVLLLAWKCNVEYMCRFSKTEFVTGCRTLKADSVRAMQHRLSETAIDVMNNKELFKDLYRFTFKFGLEPGQKVLPVDMAVSLWQLVFSQRTPPLLPRFVKFLEEHPEVRGIPRDTWNMFLSLHQAIGDDLSLYDDTEAWPSLFDDFVEYENDKANQNDVYKIDLNKRRSGNFEEDSSSR